MSYHESFQFESSTELVKKAEALGIELPFQDNISNLFDEVVIGRGKAANRMAVQPMEGFDATPKGSPSELTFRRYRRFGGGGSGIIWFEATCVAEEGRSNPRQLMLYEKSLDGFKYLVEETRRSVYKTFGNSREVFLVLQLTHSGRYSKPEGKPAPLVAAFNPFLDRQKEDVCILSDEELDFLQLKYIKAACLAYEAGFDAIDIKACHGYLVNDLLAAYTRKNSRYGGDFENRIRFLTEVIKKIRAEVPEIYLAVRMNAYDGVPYPFGFGSSVDGSYEMDLREPKELVERLIGSGCSIFNVTAGIPCFNPHFGRPFDRPILDESLPEEHPLEGISRLIKMTAELQKSFPKVPFVGTGYSWLRQFLPNVGASVVHRGGAGLIGLGRSSIAYPDAPKNLMDKGIMDSRKVCITCSRCSELMRKSRISGCVIHDREIYGREYQKLFGCE